VNYIEYVINVIYPNNINNINNNIDDSKHIYKQLLLFSFLSEFFAASGELHYQAKKTPFFCINSLKKKTLALEEEKEDKKGEE